MQNHDNKCLVLKLLDDILSESLMKDVYDYNSCKLGLYDNFKK